MYFARVLERLGGNALSKDQEPDIGAAFLKFAVVHKELSALMKTLVSCICYVFCVNKEVALSSYLELPGVLIIGRGEFV